MTTQEAKQKLEALVHWKASRFGGQPPIYEIVLFEHPDKELVYHRDGTDVHSGFPDADINPMGFYYELDTAIEAMHGNWLDIQETVFHAGFILCKYPGLYECAGR